MLPGHVQGQQCNQNLLLAQLTGLDSLLKCAG